MLHSRAGTRCDGDLQACCSLLLEDSAPWPPSMQEVLSYMLCLQDQDLTRLVPDLAGGMEPDDTCSCSKMPYDERFVLVYSFR